MNKSYNEIEYYLTCSRGLEEVTAKDIAPYCNKITRVDDGGVAFTGDKKTLYNVNLYSRTGMYVLKKLDGFKSHSLDDLYKKIKNYSWSKLVKKTSTIAVRVKSDSDIFTNPNFCTLKVKDAVVDSIKDQKKFRPYVDRKNPDYSIFVFIKDKDVQVFLNSSGAPLFMRGYRTKIHKASLNESLAAGLILLSGWDKETPFYDPMCGSGTIPIEAALMAKNVPPGIYRNEFGFQRWKRFDPDMWKQCIDEAKEAYTDCQTKIYGSDVIEENITLCNLSSRKTDNDLTITFRKKDIRFFQPKSNSGVVIINPPYGHRIGEEDDLEHLYKVIGDTLKKNCKNFDAFIFTASGDLTKSIGLRTKKRVILKNGNIDCRLLHYEIVEGEYS